MKGTKHILIGLCMFRTALEGWKKLAVLVSSEKRYRMEGSWEKRAIHSQCSPLYLELRAGGCIFYSRRESLCLGPEEVFLDFDGIVVPCLAEPPTCRQANGVVEKRSSSSSSSRPGGGAAPQSTTLPCLTLLQCRTGRSWSRAVECIQSVQFSRSIVSDSLWPHGLQRARPPCPSPIPKVHLNPCPLSQWCHPTISSSLIRFSSCPQSFPASGSFPVSQFFASGGQSIGVSASASVLPMNIQDWSPLGWTGWLSLLSKGLSRVFSNTIVQKHLFFGAQVSL